MNHNINLLKVRIKRKVNFGNSPVDNLLVKVCQYLEVKIKADLIFQYKGKVF